jgi:hypothetical protein
MKIEPKTANITVIIAGWGKIILQSNIGGAKVLPNPNGPGFVVEGDPEEQNVFLDSEQAVNRAKELIYRHARARGVDFVLPPSSDTPARIVEFQEFLVLHDGRVHVRSTAGDAYLIPVGDGRWTVDIDPSDEPHSCYDAALRRAKELITRDAAR